MTRKPQAEPPHGRTTILQPGRKPFYCVNDKNGQPVQSSEPLAYLAWHKSTGRFYVSPSTPKVYLGRELDLAIWRFREWSQGQGKQEHKYQIEPTGFRSNLGIPPLDDWKNYKDTWHDKVPLDVIASYGRDLIITDPRKASEFFGIPELARLASIPKPEPSLALAELFELYATHSPGRSGDGLAERWIYNSRPFWSEFCKLVPVTTVVDVTVDHVIAYGDRIKAAATSPTYARHRYGLVKSVLNFAITRGKDQEQLQRVLTACKVLKMPRANGTNPKDIDPKDFAKLLAVADVKFKAIYLLSLNAALYPSEVAAVEKSHVNLSKRTLVMDRAKTGLPRVAVLWPETVKAIKAYQTAHPHGSEFVFISSVGKAYTANIVSRNHRKIREKAGVSAEFAHIRDGAETAAAQISMDQAKLIAGHRVSGMSDAYVRRTPSKVADACEAIRKAYLGAR